MSDWLHPGDPDYPYDEVLSPPRRILDGIEGYRIPTRHHRDQLLLPMAGDSTLDRFWIAQLAREVLADDWQHRAKALAQAQRGATMRPSCRQRSRTLKRSRTLGSGAPTR